MVVHWPDNSVEKHQRSIEGDHASTEGRRDEEEEEEEDDDADDEIVAVYCIMPPTTITPLSISTVTSEGSHILCLFASSVAVGPYVVMYDRPTSKIVCLTLSNKVARSLDRNTKT